MMLRSHTTPSLLPPDSGHRHGAVEPRRPGTLSTLKRLLQAVRQGRAGARPPSLREVASAFIGCARHVHAFSGWFDNPDNVALEEVLRRRPSLVCCVRQAYLNREWNGARRATAIEQHYWLLSRHFDFLHLAPGQSIALASLGDGRSIRLDAAARRFEREGELSLSLRHGNLRIWSLTFNFGQEEMRKTAYVGGLHGPDGEDGRGRPWNRGPDGSRSRDLLICAFRKLCDTLGVDRIRAVSDKARVGHRAWRPKRAMSYDAAWLKNGGAPDACGFFALDSGSGRRSRGAVPSRRRVEYRRRRQFIDAMGRQIDDSIRRTRSARMRDTASGADADGFIASSV